jgi:hypothetical protein
VSKVPSSAVHITIADEAAQILHVADLPSFLLGSIAPDAVNVNGFAPREVRYKAHLRSRSYDEWKRNIAAFRTEHEAEYTSCPDFFKGVLLHLYTDIAWDELVQPLLFAEFRRRGVPDDDFTDEKWKELDRLDAVLFAEPQYSASAADVIAQETGAKVYTLDPVVTGEDSPDAYLSAMRKNTDTLLEALG